MYSVMLRSCTRLLVNGTGTSRMTWQPAIQAAYAQRRMSSSEKPTSGSGSKAGSGVSGMKPVSIQERTINLAHQTSYTSAPGKCAPKKGPICPCPQPKPTTPPRQVPGIKPVQTCGVQDLSKRCPPPPRPCPPKKQLTAMDVLMFLVKVAVVAGLVYWTIDIGVWGNSNQSAALFTSMRTAIREMLRMKADEADSHEVPKTDHMYHNALLTWNRGVVCVFDAIRKLCVKLAELTGLSKPPGK